MPHQYSNVGTMDYGLLASAHLIPARYIPYEPQERQEKAGRGLNQGPMFRTLETLLARFRSWCEESAAYMKTSFFVVVMRNDLA